MRRIRLAGMLAIAGGQEIHLPPPGSPRAGVVATGPERDHHGHIAAAKAHAAPVGPARAVRPERSRTCPPPRPGRFRGAHVVLSNILRFLPVKRHGVHRVNKAKGRMNSHCPASCRPGAGIPASPCAAERPAVLAVPAAAVPAARPAPGRFIGGRPRAGAAGLDLCVAVAPGDPADRSALLLAPPAAAITGLAGREGSDGSGTPLCCRGSGS
jgi:hypothetical protein